MMLGNSTLIYSFRQEPPFVFVWCVQCRFGSVTVRPPASTQPSQPSKIRCVNTQGRRIVPFVPVCFFFYYLSFYLFFLYFVVWVSFLELPGKCHQRLTGWKCLVLRPELMFVFVIESIDVFFENSWCISLSSPSLFLTCFFFFFLVFRRMTLKKTTKVCSINWSSRKKWWTRKIAESSTIKRRSALQMNRKVWKSCDSARTNWRKSISISNVANNSWG